MSRILVPVDDSAGSLPAVRHAIAEFRKNPAVQIHLLNVQRPFSQYIARFLGAAERHAYYREQSTLGLQPGRRLLDEQGVPYRVHMEIGDKARVISELARRLRCDRIVMSTARKSSLLRWIESSTTNRVIELTPVPVVVIAGGMATAVERYGLAAGLGAALASLLLAAAS